MANGLYGLSIRQDYKWSDNDCLVKSSIWPITDTILTILNVSDPNSLYYRWYDNAESVTEYGYDARCNRTSLTNYNLASYNKSLINHYYSSFTNGSYDALGNLVSYTAKFYPQPGFPSFLDKYPSAYLNGAIYNIGYGYDSNDRVVSDTLSGSYQYDPAGNMTTFANGAFTFNVNNQLSGTGFGYDNNGNPTLYKGQTFSFDALNRLTQVSNTIKYSYLPDGTRAWKEFARYDDFNKKNELFRQYYVYDNGQIIGDTLRLSSSTGSTMNKFYYGIEGLFFTSYPEFGIRDDVAIPMFDLTGNCVQHISAYRVGYYVGNKEGPATISQQLFTAYGQTIEQFFTPDDFFISSYAWGRYIEQMFPFLYKGKYGYYTDTDTGLIYCQSRFYDPATGRWLTRDPISYEGGINLYEYCDGNPVMNVDPSGLAPWGHEEHIPEYIAKLQYYKYFALPLDTRTEKLLSTLEEPVAWAARLFLDDVRKAGKDVRITQGSRTWQEQNELYAQGRTKPGSQVTNARGGTSNHNFAIAFDIGIFQKRTDGKSDYLNESSDYAWVSKFAKKYGLEWGGDWKRIDDKPHYQYPAGSNYAKLRQMVHDKKQISKYYWLQ